MARYIDADVTKEVLSSHEDRRGYLIGDFEQIIDEEVPTADVVEVVRCKDCRHRQGFACDYSAVWVQPNGYCQYGERRDDG